MEDFLAYLVIQKADKLKEIVNILDVKKCNKRKRNNMIEHIIPHVSGNESFNEFLKMKVIELQNYIEESGMDNVESFNKNVLILSIFSDPIFSCLDHFNAEFLIRYVQRKGWPLVSRKKIELIKYIMRKKYDYIRANTNIRTSDDLLSSIISRISSFDEGCEEKISQFFDGGYEKIEEDFEKEYEEKIEEYFSSRFGEEFDQIFGECEGEIMNDFL